MSRLHSKFIRLERIILPFVILFIPNIILARGSGSEKVHVLAFPWRFYIEQNYSPGYGYQITSPFIAYSLLFHLPLIYVMKIVLQFEFREDRKNDLVKLNWNIMLAVFVQYLMYWVYAYSLVIGYDDSKVDVIPISLLLVIFIILIVNWLVYRMIKIEEKSKNK